MDGLMDEETDRSKDIRTNREMDVKTNRQMVPRSPKWVQQRLNQDSDIIFWNRNP